MKCIIFDWDDTLVPTLVSFRNPMFMKWVGIRCIENANRITHKTPYPGKHPSLDQAVFKMLSWALNTGIVCIISNSERIWLDLCIEALVPSIIPLLNQIPIYTAEHECRNQHPNNPAMWKQIQTSRFVETLKPNTIDQFVGFGDQTFDSMAFYASDEICCHAWHPKSHKHVGVPFHSQVALGEFGHPGQSTQKC